MKRSKRLKWLRRLLWLYRLPAYLLLGLVGLAVGYIAFSYAMTFTDSYRLPNGMIVKRQLDSRYFRGRSDLYAADGKKLLARGLERICFDDRYVATTGGDGTFDGKTGEEISGRVTPSILNEASEFCAGYFFSAIPAMSLFVSQPDSRRSACEKLNSRNQRVRSFDWRIQFCGTRKHQLDPLGRRYAAGSPASRARIGMTKKPQCYESACQ